MRIRLTPAQATHLGLEVKPYDKGNARYKITEEQYNSLKKEPESKAKPFILSAWKQSGGVMNIDEYCETHQLPREDVRSYKLVSHTGIPFYNIQFREKDMESESLDPKFVKSYLKNHLNFKVDKKKLNPFASNIGVVKIADLHYGALISNLLKTKDYSPAILAEKLEIAAMKINRYTFDTTHVHIHGDLIESFTGLNHKNSWKSMDVNLIGAMAVKGCAELLHKHFLSNINNLGSVKIVAGNHDRISSDNKEDEDGDAANLIAWGLELIGYDVEFNSNILTHEVAGINHVIVHGHNIVSKRATKDIIWDYGKQGMFNLVAEGHLHSLIERLSVNQRNTFKTIKDDSLDHRRVVLPSFFPGNSYSERLSYFSHSGFAVVSSYNGLPEMDYRMV